MKPRAIFVILCTVGLFAILSSTLSKNPVLPLFAKHLGANEPEIGVIAAASTIPGILLSIPAGAISDVYGRRRIIWFSLLIFSSAPLFYLLVTTPRQLVVVRFYHGFATAIFGTVVMAMIAEQYPKHRGERMSLFSSATLAGRSAAPFVGGILLTIASFQAVYLVCAMSAGLALLVALFIPKDVLPYQVEQNTKTQNQIRTIQGLWEVVGNFRVMVTSSMEAAQFFVYGAVEVFLILYANSIGLEGLQLGIIAGIPIVVAGITKPIMGLLSDRVGRKPLIVAGFVVGAVVVAMFQALTSFLALSLISLTFGLAFATVTSSTSAFVADVCKEDSFGAALGVLNTIMDIGQAAGPPIIGIVVWKYGFGATFTILGGVLLVAGLIFLIMIKNYKEEQENPNN